MEVPLKIAICDDMPEDAHALGCFAAQSAFPIAIEEFHSAEDFLATFKKGKYHIIFMDIYMGGKTGIEAVCEVRAIDPHVVVAFITQSAEHTLESYRLGALKYIEKPFQEMDIANALTLARALQEKCETWPVYVNQSRVDVPLDGIYYIEVIDHACHIHTESGVLQTDMRIEDFTPLLQQPRFLRSHRAYIVNLARVKGIDRDFIMENGEKAYIRGKDLKQIKEDYANYLASLVRRQMDD